MAGVKGHRYGIFNQRIHEKRQRYRQDYFEADFRLRRAWPVRGIFGNFNVVLPYTMEEVEKITQLGIGIPLDLMPREWWRFVSDE